MNITFTRSGERAYTTCVMRDDGITLHVPSPDRPALLPHDLAHYVVERELGLQRGFWGRVAAGAVFTGMTVLAGRQPPHAAERSKRVMREAKQQDTEAEMLVSILIRIMQDGIDQNWPAARARLSEEWRPIQPARGPLTAEEVQRVCTGLREAQAGWHALAIGQSITVAWSLGTHKKRRPTRHAPDSRFALD